MRSAGDLLETSSNPVSCFLKRYLNTTLHLLYNEAPAESAQWLKLLILVGDNRKQSNNHYNGYENFMNEAIPKKGKSDTQSFESRVAEAHFRPCGQTSPCTPRLSDCSGTSGL